MTGSAPTSFARDLMIPVDAYPYVGPEATLADAISSLTGAQIERRGKLSLPRFVLVIDEGRLTGLVRRRDIMRGLLPEFLTQVEERHAESEFDFEPGLDLDLADLFRDDAHRVLGRNLGLPVDRVMQPIGRTVSPEAGLLDLVTEMIQNEAHILPVVADEQVLGVVRTVEVLNRVRRMLGL